MIMGLWGEQKTPDHPWYRGLRLQSGDLKRIVYFADRQEGFCTLSPLLSISRPVRVSGEPRVWLPTRKAHRDKTP